ncbi:toll/interleukin-1 receptor domain-containing protein [Cryomorpha ignava]|uniref:Toll/interleukin-1 receptor domain-containing protein n=1 Tax=Cryomorpha ignava TaxID=101383 RepID=A0A7K3WRP2_9FLAO|nr:toll/interleukin-1 receptor domain-containing protein [Cryomorpha ignava]NEN24198.1 toll/interleukin-1 receptor domain-containing protein [Cryomorpha ignava]
MINNLYDLDFFETLFKKGSSIWNSWRKENPNVKPVLRKGEFKDKILIGFDFSEIHLSHANFNGSVLKEVIFDNCIFERCRFESAIIDGCAFIESHCHNSNFSNTLVINTAFHGASLHDSIFDDARTDIANFSGADLRRVSFINSDLKNADFGGATLIDAIFKNSNLDGAQFGWTKFGNNDLAGIINLDKIIHEGPSYLDINTIMKSLKILNSDFLQGVGASEIIIERLRSLTDIEVNKINTSCFISYSHKDTIFANALYEELKAADINVWYAPMDMQGGKKSIDQIQNAVKKYDRLLIILSDDSLNSEWVKSELREALAIEKEIGVQKLFPIRIVDFEKLKEWKCFDSDLGKDLGVELREYHIPDFTNWQNKNVLEKAIEKLISDLISRL